MFSHATILAINEKSSKAGPRSLLTRDYFTWLRGMIMIFIGNDADDDDDNYIEMTEYNYLALKLNTIS